ncbi:hypothetical protein [Rhodomicrobium sp. R_RK_3]|uniref:phage tail tape measure protein n=1 Tax=Rhodomicrobium sp. R_RK_3 TaxID=2029567 RepID=UPI000B4BF491|nr:hypothetical protein [Rhodomicrobium sp. R_RK_3]
MAESSVVGALRVTLGLNAAEFDKGVDKAADSLARLHKAASVVGTAIGVTFGAAATAIGVSVHRAVVELDKFGELSQSIGVPVQQLTGLAHAAQLSGVELDGLGTAFKKLSVNMMAIASGDTTSTAARSFAALGVAVRDATGAMRPAGDVFIDVAAKFATLQDGASKTALAVALFGRAGADLIPLLNQGREGLKLMADEAEALGLVVTNRAVKASDSFSDSMNKLGAAFTGIGRQIMDRLGPAVAHLTERFVEWVKESRIVHTIADTIAVAFKSLATVGVVLKGVYDELTSSTIQFARALTAVAQLKSGDVVGAWDTIKQAVAGSGEGAKAATQSFNELWAAASGEEAQAAAATHKDKVAAPIIQSTEAMAAAKRDLNEEEREWQRLITDGVKLAEATRSPSEIFAEKARALDAALQSNDINAQQFAAAMQKATFVAANAYASMASGIASNLATAFGNSKAFAIAAAIINTAESVTKTLATYGATPWGFAAAAAAAAAGAAQISAIRSTTKGGGGGGGGGASPAAAAPAAEAPQQGVFIQLNGETFGRAQVRGLIEQIQGAIDDGMTLRLTQA